MDDVISIFRFVVEYGGHTAGATTEAGALSVAREALTWPWSGDEVLVRRYPGGVVIRSWTKLDGRWVEQGEGNDAA